ncbi:serine/threonine-protein kinase [Paenibacillus qinlingensis]|uniref:non-specific serine/threonine protein kinase n=1 Tax=Paenibacillus qinlingensis TaxID=1837343 RepID=A0ABU1NQD8_9BACL|nr:serine/threonine-protein kinase [Paenibacillus qinlingensis]MDR6549685.1 serine/threonine-protein kinase [Paenibacillus qinlingensis]
MHTPQWQGMLIGGRYRLISLLGQGGMSQVYLAEDEKLRGKRWAVKEILFSDTDTNTFLEEAEMLAKLGHAQLPQLVDYFITEEKKGYLVMDYIEGPTLQDLFEQHHREMPITQIVQIAFQLIDIFHYLHTFQPRPIIYRDLKPSNVMLNEHNQVRLIDFGVARQFKQGQASDTMQMGTIGFAAPEQYLGQQTDARSDLYTLGSLLYYLLSGGHYAYLTPKPLGQLKSGIPEDLLTTVHLLLQDQPQNRCQTAMEVRHRLRSMYPDEPSSNSKQKHTSPIKFTDQLIVVGGLFAGIGATFTAVTLARILHALQIPNALVEQPTIDPDLYMLLYGDRHAPDTYKFPSQLLQDPTLMHTSTVWTNGFTTWVPTDPDGMTANWQSTDSFKLLHMIKKPIVLWDVSTQWEHPAVKELCNCADSIIVMIDASPGKCTRPSSRKFINLFESYQKRGIPVHYIARGNIPTQFRKEWEGSLPAVPLCTMPEIPRDDVLNAIWKGECIQDSPAYLPTFSEALGPILREMLPKVSLKSLDRPRRKSLFSKFNKLG